MGRSSGHRKGLQRLISVPIAVVSGSAPEERSAPLVEFGADALDRFALGGHPEHGKAASVVVVVY